MPLPPRPPLATTRRSPGVTRSRQSRPSAVKTRVPMGTGMIRVLAAFAVAVLALAALAVFRLKDAAAPEVGQGAQARGGFEDDVAPGPAMAAVRAAYGLEPGPEEADTARAAVAGPDRDIDFVRKGFQVWG